MIIRASLFEDEIRKEMQFIKSIGAKLAGVFALSLILAACSTTTSTSTATGLSGSLEPQPLAEKTKVVISMASTSETYASLLLAIESGEFEKENLDVEIVNLLSPDAMAALVEGEIDASAVVLGATTFNAIAQGAPIRLVMNSGANSADTGFWIRTELLDGAPESLRGKTIAGTYGWTTPSMTTVKDYLATAGLTTDDVQMEILSAEDAALALDAGSIDGAWLTTPTHLPLVASGNAQKVAGYEPGQISTGFLFGDRLLNKNPEIGQAFVRAIIRTTTNYLSGDYKQDPEIGPMLAAALGVSLEDLQVTESLEFKLFDTETMLNEQTKLYTNAQEMWIGMGEILTFEEPLTGEQYLDWSFVQRILDENNL